MRVCVAALFVMLLSTGNAWADSFRCNNNVVKRGDSSFDVLQHCGEPDWEQTRYEEILRGDPRGFQVRYLVTVEEWLYKGRSGRFDRRLIFYDGRLHRVKLGQRR